MAFVQGGGRWTAYGFAKSRITTQNKYLWVIEGDITGCFDHVQHAILLKLVKRRVQRCNESSA